MLDASTPLSFGYFTVALLAIATLAFASSLQFLVVGIRERNDSTHLAFSALCACIAVFAFGNALMNAATSLAFATIALRVVVGATVEERLPERTQQATLRALGDDELRAIVDAYVEAWERNDVDAVVALLAQDATFSMPPIAAWYRGREAIRAFLPTGPMSAPRRFVPLRASGQPAFGTYLWIPEREELVVNAVHVIGLRGSEIADATAFLSREVTEAFGLPEVLR